MILLHNGKFKGSIHEQVSIVTIIQSNR